MKMANYRRQLYMRLMVATLTALIGVLVSAIAVNVAFKYAPGRLMVYQRSVRVSASIAKPARVFVNLRNLGTLPVAIRGISTGCGCTGRTLVNLEGSSVLPPFAARILAVTIFPDPRAPQVRKDIVITTNEHFHPEHDIPLDVSFRASG